MNFDEDIKNFADRIKSMKNNILTEEATKTSLIMPFFQLLGYDVFNPMEFIPEFTADVGTKKGEKVDYAISVNNKLRMLIEAKSINENLEKYDSQLFRYFGTTKAKFAILTNGTTYKFYTDLEEPNVMDLSPFLEIDLYDLTESDIIELKKFNKDSFDMSQILDSAAELKYLGMIKKILKSEFTNPSDEFVKLILNNNIYNGVKTQNIIDKYRPILKKSISIYINELVNDKIQNALKSEENNDIESEVIQIEDDIINEATVVTTEEELQAYYIVKSIIANNIELKRITYKDTLSYFAVLIDNKVTKWICRIYIKEKIKYIVIPNDSENIKYTINNLDDIYKLKKHLLNRINILTK